ncbi:hypothetical protein [Gelidibacter maritimus]|uniref:Winged helix-turn-helix transcriptional regulator n=1 Tax=Gelidibacter maritimus TaxID=2761487 RepID=A0A7W2R3U0_9FLAO|nr:hypothetical protein [Gelidibacter maritimus]MBA6153207.1 hypothetical protein [Gelidibacter maritimus]
MKQQFSKYANSTAKNNFNYCRTCYNHLAGVVGVAITGAMVKRDYLKKLETAYLVTKKGWEWFSQFDISENDFNKSRRAVSRQCIDGTERRPHLAGQLGDKLLEKMLHRGWFKKIENSRELKVTSEGRQALHSYLGMDL